MGVKMNIKRLALLAIALVSVAVFVVASVVSAPTVFSDDFSSGGFASWKTNLSPGASQTVSNGVARFVVPTPTGGTVTYSGIIKDGFISTPNSSIIASQDILVTRIPNGCSEGNGAIFFLYICDSTDLAGNYGNVGVGIDGSSAWSLWIGGNLTYTYVFQTSGSAPLSNTWYHIVLVVDNSAGLVTLSVNDKVVISATQQQFTDRNHPISLMSGLGEDWWSSCVGSQQEIAVDNVRLDISDADAWFTPNPTSPSQTSTANDLTPIPTQKATTIPPISAPTSAATATPSVLPTLPPSPTSSPTTIQATDQGGLPTWILLPVAIVMAACVVVLFMLKKR
jgi:hypothetical protein